MVRKQIYLEDRHDAMLKRLARARGVSEAQIIRQALDRHSGAQPAGAAPDARAWAQALSFMRGRRRTRRPVRGGRRRWTRADLYDVRLGRHARHSR